MSSKSGTLDGCMFMSGFKFGADSENFTAQQETDLLKFDLPSSAG
jgi:hypothetical protein